MVAKFTLYVDESGDSGIEKIRDDDNSAASPYFAIGAALIADSIKDVLRTKLKDIGCLFKRNSLHCVDLKHRQKIKYIREIQPCSVIMFSVVSRKSTLLSYRDTISRNNEKYYNKCAQYLLEKVGRFLDSKGIEEWQVSIEFEECGFDQSKLKNLLRQCRKNPLNAETRFLEKIDPDRIKWVCKTDEPLLALADLVAHAAYQCINKSAGNYDITEPRYLKELFPKLYACPLTGKIDGFGFKSVHSLSELKLELGTLELIRDFRADTEGF